MVHRNVSDVGVVLILKPRIGNTAGLQEDHLLHELDSGQLDAGVRRRRPGEVQDPSFALGQQIPLLALRAIRA